MIDFLLAITREAGERILTQKRQIKGKKEGGGNWVTQADLVSERYLTSAIHQAYSLHQILTDPGYKILSEEFNSSIPHPEKEPHLWVIDPLDGSTNFAFNLPLFAVSVAYLEKGVAKAGAIYFPFRRELFYAAKNKGAFLNNEKIKIKKSISFNGALINIGSPYKQETFRETYPAGKLFHAKGARIVNLGSAALELSYVACGRLSLYYETGLKPWDVAGGKLIIEEAGGEVISVEKKFDLFNFNSVLSGNSALVKQAKNSLQKLFSI